MWQSSVSEFIHINQELGDTAVEFHLHPKVKYDSLKQYS